MRDFQVLFDNGERSELLDPVLARYGKLGFPAAPAGRPWIYWNFVQSIDGVVSLGGADASGADIAQSEEDRWLMDLLRAHADAVLLGMGTLREEQRLGRPRPRGPVFRILDPELLGVRAKLQRRRERNIFVTARADFQLKDFAAFDGEYVDATIVTTGEGARRLEAQKHPAVEILAARADAKGGVEMKSAMEVLHARYGLRHLLGEGGPGLYAAMLQAGLVDEKFLTVAPLEVGLQGPEGVRPTMLPKVGFGKEDAVHWTWLSCRRVGDHQFHRLRRKGIC
ncbi:MAG: RibD family protein [Acidobacteriota bacterium]|nr:RibD family protein [Acidobacteriota bacterium]